MRAIWRRYPLLTTVLAIGAFLLLAPFEAGPRERANGIVVAEVILFVTLVAILPFRAGSAPVPDGGGSSDRVDWWPPVVCLILWLLSWTGPMATSALALDDLQYLYPESTQGAGGLLARYNEHIVLLPRTWAWVVRSLGDALGDVHAATVVARMALFAVVLLYAHRFFLRVSGSRLAAAAATAVFSQLPAITEVYLWFAASLWLLPLLLLIVGLDGVQRYTRQQRRPASAAVQVFLATALSPVSFWIGALNGPVCALVAFFPSLQAPPRVRRRLFAGCMAAAGTLLGAAVGLALLRATGSSAVHGQQLGNLLVWRRALLFSARFLTDHILPGSWWAAIRDSYAYAYPLAFAAIAGGIVLIAFTVAMPRVAVPPLALALASYAVVFLSRGDIPYQTGLRISDRYQLYPHFCLAWLLALWLGSRRTIRALDASPPGLSLLIAVAVPLLLWAVLRPGAPGQTFSVVAGLLR